MALQGRPEKGIFLFATKLTASQKSFNSQKFGY
jgi:hypothetical protein